MVNCTRETGTKLNAGIIWPLKQHTQAKHMLLRKYLVAWYPILTSSGKHKRIFYLDGFAGPGVYTGGQLGSPIIALDTLVNNATFRENPGIQFTFFFIEDNVRRYKNLKMQIDRFWRRTVGGKPKNVIVKSYNEEFTSAAKRVCQYFQIHHKPVPTFAFIDPFGWAGVQMSIIRSLLASDKCEVLFNFMYDSVNRFVTGDTLSSQFDALFGTENQNFSELRTLDPQERKRYLLNLYKTQLKNAVGFKYVKSFDLYRSGGAMNSLVFGTNSITGLKVMKDAMWKIDPDSGVCFTGFIGDQMRLHFGPSMDTLQELLTTNFAGQVVSIEQIEKFVLECTDFTASHYKSQLKSLEREGLIECISDRNRRWTYPPGTILQFNGGGKNRQLTLG